MSVKANYNGHSFDHPSGIVYVEDWGLVMESLSKNHRVMDDGEYITMVPSDGGVDIYFSSSDLLLDCVTDLIYLTKVR